MIVLFKGTFIEAWTGIFAIQGNPDFLSVTYDAGMGNKNSAGFGMWEIWHPHENLTVPRNAE